MELPILHAIQRPQMTRKAPYLDYLEVDCSTERISINAQGTGNRRRKPKAAEILAA